MQYLSVENVSKTYGEKVLLDDISFIVSKGDKIGLVAKNGSGKSTFLRMITGGEAPEGEHAKISLTKDTKISYLWQEPEMDDANNVREEIYSLNLPEIEAIKAYESAQRSEDPDQLSEALIKMEQLKAWDIDARIRETLSKLNIEDLDQGVTTLSGGQKKRLALAKLIIEDAQFIILDEPTNHLDIDMIEWLEAYLQRSNLTLFMVTHDRYFLERVCNSIIELDRGKIYRYSGNYGDFLLKRSARLENESAVLSKTKKLYKKELEWIRRQPKARGTKAKSRVSSFEDIKEAAHKNLDNQEMKLLIKSERLGSKILEAHRVCKSFDDKVIIDDFSYKFKKKERVGIVGVNGAGKSTFIKVMTAEMRPTSGRIVKGDTVNFGHFNQEGLQLKQDKMIIDVVRDIAEYIPLEKGQKMTAASLLEMFLFPRPQQRVYVSQLSGGEKRRLHLLTVLMTNPNFLILDEPTNDLDIMTLNILEEYLVTFPGCLLIVSHDRYFMDKLVDHLFIFEGEGKIKDYNGNYSEYRAEKKIEKNEAPKKVSTAQTTAAQPETEERKMSYLEKKEMRSIENKTKKLEEKKKEIADQFLDSNLDNAKITELSQELGEIEKEIERLENRWLELSELA